MIKSITIEAVSIKTTNKDGTPYMWMDKKTNQKKPRTMVSVKYKDATTGPEGDWLMGWSYKTGSAAEALTAGQTIEIKYEESTKVNDDGTTYTFKSWRFPKEEDKKDDEIAKLKAQLASLNTPTGVPAPATTVGNVASLSQVTPVQSGTHTPTPAVVSDGSVPVDEVPFSLTK